MALRPLLRHALDDDHVAALARDGGEAFVSPSLRPYLIAALLDGTDAPGPAVVVAGDDRAARDLAADLRVWLEPRPVRFYPSRGVAYESHLAPPAHLVGLRVAALDALVDADPSDPDAPVVVVSTVALSEKVPDPALRPHGLRLAVGDLVDLDELATDLVAAGYQRVDQVEDRGQFAVRGGLIDLFAATEDRAVRVDLFGDEIESLRWFSTFSQRSLGDAESVEISPAAELDADTRELAELAAMEDAEARPDVAELLPVGDFKAFLELVPDAAVTVLAAEEEIAPALADLWQDVTAAFHDADAHHLYVKPAEIEAALADRAQLRLTSVLRDQPIAFHAQAADTAARSLTEAEPELEKLVRSGYRTIVTWARHGDGERAAYNLARSTPQWLGEHMRDDGGLRFAQARLRDGFIAAGLKLAVIPDHRLIRPRRGTPSRPRAGALRSFADLRTGDIVVHEDHGIARFAGFDTKTVAGVTRDYLYLEYKGDDRVFVPSDQLSKISRYVGGSTDDPPLSKLGGARWEQMKARARRAAQELAGELLNLYAERKRRVGYAFEPDGEWQRDFEERFPHTETPDQRDAIEQVKADMEAPRPMDRLICGDVGYGKTEVALRAAFKACADGKQVMMLVPTTILAQQHYGTFAERFRDWPFTVDHVSRFRSPKDQKAAIKGFAEGRGDPAQDAVGRHHVEGWPVDRWGSGQGEEIRLFKVDVAQAGGLGESASVSDVRRQEIHSYEVGVRVVGRHHAQIHTLSTAQIQIVERLPQIGRSVAVEQSGKGKSLGKEFVVHPVGVALASVVALVPVHR